MMQEYIMSGYAKMEFGNTLLWMIIFHLILRNKISFLQVKNQKISINVLIFGQL